MDLEIAKKIAVLLGKRLVMKRGNQTTDLITGEDVGHIAQCHASSKDGLYSLAAAVCDGTNNNCSIGKPDTTCRGYSRRKCGVYYLVPFDREKILAADIASLIEAERDTLRARFTASVVCICGSTKFKQAWIAENARLTGEGNIVLAVGIWGHHERVFPDAKTKAFLEDTHKRKIDLCDWVWVLDVGGYIGDGTRSEIDYALLHGKPVRYLSIEFPYYKEPIDPVVAERDRLREQLKTARQEALEEAAAYANSWDMDDLADGIRALSEGGSDEWNL